MKQQAPTWPDEARLPASAQAGPGLDGLTADDLCSFLSWSELGWTADGILAARILLMVREGMTRADIAGATGLSKVSVSRALAVIRACASEWACSG